MDFELGKKSGQIPAFGDWDNANDLPITQYFESARQAGLLRNVGNATTATATANRHPHHHHQYCDNSYSGVNVRRSSGGGGYGYSGNVGRKAVHGGVDKCINNNGPNGYGGHELNNRRRGAGAGYPRHLPEEQQQRIIKQQVIYNVADLKHHHHHNHHRTRRSSSQQLFHHSNDHHHHHQKKKQFPKHSAIVADLLHKPPPVAPTNHNNNIKPVDEDLYKIPPELLLHHSKGKKMLGFFSKCLVPPCSA